MAVGAQTMEFSDGVQTGGVVAIVLGALGIIGKGLAWLLNYHGERSEGRAKEMRVWEASLARREKEYRETIEAEIAALRAAQRRDAVKISYLANEVGALRKLCGGTVEALRRLDPSCEALVEAERHLQQSFRDYDLPEDLRAALDEWDRLDKGA